MSFKSILILVSCIGYINAECGTTGCGTQPCVNDKHLSCNNCGCQPCVDINDICWSCAGADLKCYAYNCGDYCSSVPCSAISDPTKLVAKYENTTMVYFRPSRIIQKALLIKD